MKANDAREPGTNRGTTRVAKRPTSGGPTMASLRVALHLKQLSSGMWPAVSLGGVAAYFSARLVAAFCGTFCPGVIDQGLTQAPDVPNWREQKPRESLTGVWRS
jgi:hypothetical protein